MVFVVTIVMLLLTVPVLLILREAAMAELTARTEQAASAVESLVRDDLENEQVPDLSITDEIVSDGDGVRIFEELEAMRP